MAEHAGIDYYFFLFILGAYFDTKKLRFDKDLLLQMCSSEQFLYSARG